MTTFGVASFTLITDDDKTSPQWETKPRIDLRDMLGTSETVVNVLGTSAPTLTCRAVCKTKTDYDKLVSELTNRHSLAITGDTRNAVLTAISSPKRHMDGKYLCSVSFLQVN